MGTRLFIAVLVAALASFGMLAHGLVSKRDQFKSCHEMTLASKEVSGSWSCAMKVRRGEMP